MIVVRSPLRLPLGGGGTDLPSYYRHAGGSWLSAALDLHVEVAVWHPGTDAPGAAPAAGAENPLVQAATLAQGVPRGAVSCRLHSAVAEGSGLGASGSIAVALVVALDALEGRSRTLRDIAVEAAAIEQAAVGPTAGEQDPWIAAVGGITWFEVDRTGAVRHEPVALPAGTIDALHQRLALFAVGSGRLSANLLRDQHDRSQRSDQKMLENLRHIEELGRRSRAALEAGDVDAFGAMLHEHWELKRRRSPGISTEAIDHWYQVARDAGCVGGKVVGAGGGGHLLVCAPDLTPVRAALAVEGLHEVPCRLGAPGASVIER